MKLGKRRLYLCTPDREDLESFVTACVAGGVDVVQLREERLSPKDLAVRAKLLKSLCGDLGVPFILNNDPVTAAEVGADGVHVGQDDMAPSEARQLLRPDGIIGLSTHESAQLAAGLKEPVDYLSVGPVVPTPTKPGRPGTGLGYVTEAARACRAVAPERAFFVTGNARPETVADIVAAGARRIVVVRWLTESSEPKRAARQLLDALDRAIEAGKSAST